ncbi:hypothetical protein CR513_47176, partial [Mucuna pruriens]
MERLIREEILRVFHFSNFDTCADCIQGKLTARARKSMARNEKVLQLIYTDICGPITPITMGGFRYFVIFIDDFSRYDWVELLHEKSKSLDAFKTFKVVTKLKLSMKIMCVRSDKGSEFYGRYNETGRKLGPFARIVVFRHNIPYLAHLNKMRLVRGGIAPLWICDESQ